MQENWCIRFEGFYYYVEVFWIQLWMPSRQSSYRENHFARKTGEITSLNTVDPGWFDNWTVSFPNTFTLSCVGPALRQPLSHYVSPTRIDLPPGAFSSPPGLETSTPLANLDLFAGSCCVALCGACMSPSWLCITLSTLCTASLVCVFASLLSILGSGEDLLQPKLSLPLFATTHNQNSHRSCFTSENRTSELCVCVFPNDPQASLNNLLVDIQRPRLEANQWLRSFLLDPRSYTHN